jgi:Carboxypeptidase regulatory-like domain
MLNRAVGVFFRSGVALSLFIAVGQRASMAQQVTGTILGTVSDQSSAAMPQVTVTVTSIDTGQAWQTVTDSSGFYRFTALPIGTYRVEASVSGFRQFAADNVELFVNQERRVDIAMAVGAVQQKVEVSAAAVQVETTNTQLGDVIQDQTLLSLPLNGRSFVDLLSTQAGVAPGTSTTNAAGGGETSRLVSGLQSPGNYSVNGQREASNAFLVNGADTSEASYFGTLIIPNLDSIAEFRLITNSFDAEFGRFSGSVMNAITKSGTNSFHGDIFEFIRNTDLDARGFFDLAVPALDRNQFGFAIGGPAIKNKLFWFTDYQGTRQNQGLSSSIYTLPTAAERNGIFAPGSFTGTVVGSYWASLLSQKLGYPVQPGESYNSVFPGGIIPKSVISPIATNILNDYVPLPNAGGNEYISPQPVGTTDDDKIGERVDFIS